MSTKKTAKKPAAARPRNDLLQAAYDLLEKHFTAEDIRWHISQTLSREEAEHLYSAVDLHGHRERERLSLMKIVERELKSKKTKAALQRLDDAWGIEAGVQQEAWFALGFGAASRLR